MPDLFEQDSVVENVDEVANKPQQFTVHHWTDIKTTSYSCEFDMLQANGLVKTLNCNLATADTANGAKASSRLIHFDKNYLKYQIVSLLRDVLFEISDDVYGEPDPDKYFSNLSDLFVEAIADFKQAHDVCVNDLTLKVVKSKNVTQYLKNNTYKP